MFGFGSKYRIYRLRRRYDHIRERADKLGRRKGFQVLKILDSVDGYIVQLEEQDVSMIQRKRMINSIENALQRAKTVLEAGGELRQPTDVTRDTRV